MQYHPTNARRREAPTNAIRIQQSRSDYPSRCTSREPLTCVHPGTPPAIHAHRPRSRCVYLCVNRTGMLSCIAAVSDHLDARAREAGWMELGGCRAGEVVTRFSSFSAASPRWRISNRQSPARLENAATHTKQTSEANSNRHFSEGVEPDVTLSLAHFPPANGEERSFHTLPSLGMTTKKQMAGGQSANRFCSASPHLHFPTAHSRSVLPAGSAPHPLQRGRAVLCQLRTRTHSFRAFLIASAFIRKSLISYKTNARGRF
jgi:hypothetical protein